MSDRFFKITNHDDTDPWMIPMYNYDEDLPRNHRLSNTVAVGVSGLLDNYGLGRAPREAYEAGVEFTLIGDDPQDLQDQIEAMSVAVEGADEVTGLRKIWRFDPVDYTNERWSYMRPKSISMPRVHRDKLTRKVRLQMVLHDPTFYQGLTSEWLTDNGYTPEVVSSALVPEPISPYLTFAHFDVGATPFNFTIHNPGNIESRYVLFRLESQGSNGFTNPRIVNQTTGLEFSSTQDASDSDDILSFYGAPGTGVSRWSSGGGGAWVDVSWLMALGSSQAVMMELRPGDNDFQYIDGGTPNLDLLVWWLPAYRE